MKQFRYATHPSAYRAQTGEQTSAQTSAKNGTQSGVSLVELMVATAVGLIISVGAATLFANTILNTRTLTSASQIQERGMQTIATLSRQFRQTGFVDLLANNEGINVLRQDTNAAAFNLDAAAATTLFETQFNQVPLHGCDGAYSTTGGITANTCGTASMSKNALTVAYQVISTDIDDGAAPTLSGAFSQRRGMAGDCNNNSTRNASPAVDYAVNRYFINDANELHCLGNGNTNSMPIADSVEQMVVLYGVAQTNNNLAGNTGAPSQDLSVSQYVPASTVSAANAWPRVISVRICILVAGEPNSLAMTDAALVTNKRDCTGTAFITTAERRLRQTFTQTITLRNQVRSANTSS